MQIKEVKPRLKKGHWKPEEDMILKNYVETHGEGHWETVSEKTGLMRSGKSCRYRWKNYLRPNIKRGRMSDAEKDLIVRLHKLLGNRWSLIAGRLPGRTDNEVKNYWNTNLNKTTSQSKTTSICSKKKKKKKPQELPASQPIPSKISANNTEGSDSQKEEEITVVSSWMEDTDIFNFHIEPPLTPAYSPLFFYDDEPFTPIWDSIALSEAFQSNGEEPNSMEVSGRTTGLCQEVIPTFFCTT